MGILDLRNVPRRPNNRLQPICSASLRKHLKRAVGRPIPVSR